MTLPLVLQLAVKDPRKQGCRVNGAEGCTYRCLPDANHGASPAAMVFNGFPQQELCCGVFALLGTVNGIVAPKMQNRAHAYTLQRTNIPASIR